MTTGPLVRALLLQFFARHVDQVPRVVVTVSLDETPELWGTDLAVRTEAEVAFPSAPAPMARVLDLSAFGGYAGWSGRNDDQVVGDDFLAGRYQLSDDGGSLAVNRPPATSRRPGSQWLASPAWSTACSARSMSSFGASVALTAPPPSR